ncbi:MAG: RNA methyltransferase [Bacteroidetes bacterium]|nr:RNA methyltransferase [Bacteroidota bacterium]
MREFRTKQRIDKITSVLSARQHTLRVVLENIHDPHNVSAIYRTCDAAGIPKVTLLYNVEEFPKLSKTSSASAKKWVETEKFSEAEKCITSLKNYGYKIYSSVLNKNSKSIYDIDLTDKIAIVLGNESRGVSSEVAESSDELIYIPMRGMIQSLNVSVANAVILYEAQRQRMLKGMYDTSQVTEERLNELIDDWCRK